MADASVPTGVTLWPLGAYAAAVAIVVAAMIGIPYLLGERHRERATGEPYESGIVSTGSARLRFPAHFYLIAMFFVIFDLEAVFLFAWAVAAPELGWLGYAEILETIASRLHRMPPFRQRLLEVPFGLGHPWLVDDPEFRVENHVHHVAVPSPGSLRELAAINRVRPPRYVIRAGQRLNIPACG